MTKAAIYARYSSDLSNERSAEDQTRVCREFAERKGWEVVGVYSDLAISGTSNRRPGLNALIRDAEAGELTIVVAEALDRIARHQADIATIYQRLEFAGVGIVTCSEGEVNELHIGLMGTMNALYVKELKNKIRRGQRGAVSRGRVSGGRCYGYDVTPILQPDGTLDRGHRAVNPAEADVVRRVFREYVQGISPREICKRLNRDGIPAPRGGEWRASSIVGSRQRQIGLIHNPIYAGRFIWNRVTMVQDPESRKRVSRTNSLADRVEQPMPHLRIVDEDTWSAAHSLVDRQSAQTLPQRRRPKHVFSGLVKCGTCGGSYTVISANRWGCSSHREAGTCPNPRRIATKAIEDRVLAGLKRSLLAPEAISTMVATYHAERTRLREDWTSRAEDIRLRRNKASASIGHLVAAIAAGAGEFAEVRAAMADAKNEVAQCDAELAEMEAVPVIMLQPQLVDRYRARIADLGRALNEGEETRAQALPWLRSLIDRIEITDAPDAPNKAAIVVIGSLDAAIGSTKSGLAARTARVVAEEGLEPPTRGL